MPKTASMWRLLGTKLCFVVVVLLLTMSPSLNIKSEIREDLARSNAQKLEELVQFVFTSQIGGMVGGFSAISNSTYISLSGLIQVSKEETNGVLHTLMIAHTDTSKLFKDIASNVDFTQMKKPITDNKNNVLSEYYPPRKLLAYFFQRENEPIYEYFGEAKYPKSCKKFLEKVSDFAAKTTLHYANPGLYVRAQRVPASNIQLIKFDLELERSDLLSFPTLNKILQNEMAMVRIYQKNGRAVIADNIVIKAGDPIYTRIGKDAYLIFPYHYDPHN